MKQEGKMTFLSYLMTLIVLFIVFAVFKLILAGVERGQIEHDVINKIGTARAGDFTESRGEKIIRDVLESREDIIFNEDHTVSVSFVQKGNKIRVRFDYEQEMNFLLFRTKPKLIVVDTEIDRYGI